MLSPGAVAVCVTLSAMASAPGRHAPHADLGLAHAVHGPELRHHVGTDDCIVTSGDVMAGGPTTPAGMRDYRLGRFGAVRAKERTSTDYAWEGDIVDGPGGAGGQVLHMRTSMGAVVVVHAADGSTLQAVPLGDGTSRIVRSAGALPGCAGAIAPPASAEAAQDGIASGCDDGRVLDILVMWTPLAQSQSGGAVAIRAISEASVAITNHVYATSLVNVRMRAVGYSITEAYNRDATQFVIHDLTNTSDGRLDSVHALRDSLGADVVALITGENLEYCGIAWIVGTNTPDRGFSVTVWNCALGNLTFTHEIGHNQGCCHAPGDGGGCGSGGVFQYSVGRRFTGESGTAWRTVMAYAPGVRLPRFTSPTVIHDGVAQDYPSRVAPTMPAPSTRRPPSSRTSAAPWCLRMGRRCASTLASLHRLPEARPMFLRPLTCRRRRRAPRSR
jgi:hypothetical protein